MSNVTGARLGSGLSQPTQRDCANYPSAGIDRGVIRPSERKQKEAGSRARSQSQGSKENGGT